MESLYRRCAGLDVHKKSVSACIRVQERQEVRVISAMFGTFTGDLERMREWLQEHEVEHVAMESTGVFWIPVWNVLERGEGTELQLTLINPQHVHALPGRKTDQQDCERIAELHQYGLLQGSFIPPVEVRQLRDLTRRRAHVQGERNRILNRIRQLLETVNIKLGSVVSDISGKTARLIMAEIARGECDPGELAELAQASLKNKKKELATSLNGFYSDHFRWLLGEALQDLQQLDRKLTRLDRQLGVVLQPHADLIRRLGTIPGVDFTAAAAILAEVGFDMKRFGDGAHLASWAGLCPGNNESAGKRFSARTRKGNRYLRRVLTQCAWSITHKKDCALTGLFYRMSSRGGLKKAALAVAHRMLVIVWHIISRGTTYYELGANQNDRQQPARTARRLARRLREIGFDVVVTPRATEAPSVSSPTVDGPPAPVRSRKPEAPPPKAPTPAVVSIPPAAAPRPPAADPTVCLRCSRWGIPCIHVKKSKSRPITTQVHEESTS